MKEQVNKNIDLRVNTAIQERKKTVNALMRMNVPIEVLRTSFKSNRDTSDKLARLYADKVTNPILKDERSILDSKLRSMIYSGYVSVYTDALKKL